MDIATSNGPTVVIDDDVYDKPLVYSWKDGTTATFTISSMSFSWHNTGRGYARTGGCGIHRKKTIYLHRLVSQAPPDAIVDHVNGNTLDNRLANLRLATAASNQWNYTGPVRAKSGYLGVRKNGSGWGAMISARNRRIWVGTYPTAEEAARARDAVAIGIHGVYARLNFPNQQTPAGAMDNCPHPAPAGAP